MVDHIWSAGLGGLTRDMDEGVFLFACIMLFWPWFILHDDNRGSNHRQNIKLTALSFGSALSSPRQEQRPHYFSYSSPDAQTCRLIFDPEGAFKLFSSWESKRNIQNLLHKNINLTKTKYKCNVKMTAITLSLTKKGKNHKTIEQSFYHRLFFSHLHVPWTYQ